MPPTTPTAMCSLCPRSKKAHHPKKLVRFDSIVDTFSISDSNAAISQRVRPNDALSRTTGLSGIMRLTPSWIPTVLIYAWTVISCVPEYSVVHLPLTRVFVHTLLIYHSINLLFTKLGNHEIPEKYTIAYIFVYVV